MPKLVQFADDDQVLFEVPTAPGEVSAVSRSSDVIHRLDESTEAVFESIGRMADQLSRVLAGSAAESAELEFSVQVSASGKVYVVQGEAVGGVRVKLNLGHSAKP